MNNSLAAIFNPSLWDSQNTEKLPAGLNQDSQTGGGLSFETFLNKTVPESAQDLLSQRTVSAGLSQPNPSVSPVRSEHSTEHSTEQPQPDTNKLGLSPVQNSEIEAGLFSATRIQTKEGEAKTALPAEDEVQYNPISISSFPIPLNNLSTPEKIDPEEPILAKFDVLEGIETPAPLVIPLEQIAASINYSEILEKTEREPTDYVLEIEIPASSIDENVNDTIVVYARLVPQIEISGSTGNNGEIDSLGGNFIIDKEQLLNLVKLQLPPKESSPIIDNKEFETFDSGFAGSDRADTVLPVKSSINKNNSLQTGNENVNSVNKTGEAEQIIFSKEKLRTDDTLKAILEDLVNYYSEQIKQTDSQANQNNIVKELIETQKTADAYSIHPVINENFKISEELDTVNAGNIGDERNDYLVPVIDRQALSQLLEAAQSGLPEIVIHEISAPESGKQFSLFIKPDELAASLDQLLRQDSSEQIRNNVLQDGTAKDYSYVKSLPVIASDENGFAALAVYIRESIHSNENRQSESFDNLSRLGNEPEDSSYNGDDKAIIPGDNAEPEFENMHSRDNISKIVPDQVILVKDTSAPRFENFLNIPKDLENKIVSLLTSSAGNVGTPIEVNNENIVILSLSIPRDSTTVLQDNEIMQRFLTEQVSGSNDNENGAVTSQKTASLPNRIVEDIRNIEIAISIPETADSESTGSKSVQANILNNKLFLNSADKTDGNLTTDHSGGISAKPNENPVRHTTVNESNSELRITFDRSDIVKNENSVVISLNNLKGIDTSTGTTESTERITATSTLDGSQLVSERAREYSISVDNADLKNAVVSNNGIDDDITIPVTIQKNSDKESAVLIISARTAYELLGESERKYGTANSTNSLLTQEISSENDDGITENATNGKRVSDLAKIPGVKFEGIVKISLKTSEIRESGRGEQSSKPVFEKLAENRPLVLRIPVTPPSGDSQTTGYGGVVDGDDMTGIGVETGNKNILKSDQKSSVDVKPANSVPMDAKPAGSPIDKTAGALIPQQIEITIEPENGGHESAKIQGMLIVDNAKGTSNKAAYNNLETAPDQITEEGRSSAPDKVGHVQFGSDPENGEMWSRENQAKQTTTSELKIDSTQEKIISTHNILEMKTGGDETPKTGRPLPVWNVEDLADKIVKRANLTVKKGVSEMKIQLVPPHLGKMSISIKIEDNQLLASIRVETTEAKQLIQENLHQLRDTIAEKGLEIQKFDVSVRQDFRDQMNLHRWTGHDRKGGNSRTNDSMTSDESGLQFANSEFSPDPVRLFGYNTMELIA